MSRKADAAYAIMQSSKTVEIRPKNTDENGSNKSSSHNNVTKSSKSETKPKIEPKSKTPKKQNGSESGRQKSADEIRNEEAWAAENKRLGDEIAAAQAVLAKLKPDIKPKGSKQPCKGIITGPKNNETLCRIPTKPVRSPSAEKSSYEAKEDSKPITEPVTKPRKKRAKNPGGGNTISVNPDRSRSQYNVSGSPTKALKVCTPAIGLTWYIIG